jgi:multidrug efflux pump
MIPIATTVFWSPFAFAVVGGVLVATSLTLLFLPALYVLWFRVKEPLTKEMPHAEFVPA